MIDIESIDEIYTNFEVVLGAIDITLLEFNQLAKDSVLDLGIPCGDTSFALINGEPLARGEIMVLEKNLAIRINSIISSDDIYYYPRKYFGT